MTQKIFLDGTDQYVMVRLGSINNTTGAQGLLLGALEGDSLFNLIDNIIVVFSEYKTSDEKHFDILALFDGSVTKFLEAYDMVI